MTDIIESIEIYKKADCEDKEKPDILKLNLYENTTKIRDFLINILKNVEYDTNHTLVRHILYLDKYYGINIKTEGDYDLILEIPKNSIDNEIYFTTTSGKVKLNDLIALIKLTGKKIKNHAYGLIGVAKYSLDSYDNLDHIELRIDCGGNMHLCFYLKLPKVKFIHY